MPGVFAACFSMFYLLTLDDRFPKNYLTMTNKKEDGGLESTFAA